MLGQTAIALGVVARKQDHDGVQLLAGQAADPIGRVICPGVAEHLRTTLPEMQAYVEGRGTIGDYLYQIFVEYRQDHYAWSKVIWDISTIAYLANPEWVPTEVRPSPVLRDDVTWGPEDPSRHPFRVATDLDRDRVFGDLFLKLENR